MEEFNAELFKRICEEHGIKTVETKDGECGGIFYVNDKGDYIKLGVYDIFPEFKNIRESRGEENYEYKQMKYENRKIRR